MPRVRTSFSCTECGGVAPRWLGQCPHCKAWNTLVEETVRTGSPRSRIERDDGKSARAVALAEVEGNERGRWSTGLSELDFVLGGGVVPGSLVLLGGPPGIGKSTLLLQVSAQLASNGLKTLYVSGEESVYQVKLRADRLHEPTDEVLLLSETSADAILDWIDQEQPEVLVVDSIQTLYTESLDSAAGSVAQVREVASALQRVAKTREMATFLVGHVTKEGGIAGPKTLEHIADVVLYFESPSSVEHRLVRGTKNRFGATDEIALFAMGAAGLEPLENPSALFLEGRQFQASGSAVAAAVEGSRPVLIEVQALAARSVYGTPQRVATGFDVRRLALLLAVLERRVGLRAADSDVFLNIVGGLRLSEPAADLAVVAALASALRDVVVEPDAVFIGEVGLGGEVRPVHYLERRLGEAERLGFKRAFFSGSAKVSTQRAVTPVGVGDIRQFIDALFG